MTPFSPVIYALILGSYRRWNHHRMDHCKRVKMTAMPELVSLFNGMGGACAALISLLNFTTMLVNLEESESSGEE